MMTGKNSKTDQTALGLEVSRLLTGAWRKSPSKPRLSADQLTKITPLLCQSGAPALGWWRVRNSPLAESPAAQGLHNAYRKFRLSALIHEQEIRDAFELLRGAGVEPVLVKGWAIARRYPDRALRPYGDIDLCVRPEQFARAADALKCLERGDSHYVDLHAGFETIGRGAPASVRQTQDIECAGRAKRRRRYGLPDRRIQSGVALRLPPHSKAWPELFSRSQLVPLGDTQVRILSEEDHLRILCLHLLRSGAWRTPWLCDVALALETRKPDFDWSVCLGPDATEADWVACGIGLAHELLGAELRQTAEGEGQRAEGEAGGTSQTQRYRFAFSSWRFARSPLPFAAALPRWLAPAVLRQWGRRRDANERAAKVPALLTGMRRPGKLLHELYARWENPVRATARLGGKFNNWPRLPYQLVESFLRLPELAE